MSNEWRFFPRDGSFFIIRGKLFHFKLSIIDFRLEYKYIMFIPFPHRRNPLLNPMFDVVAVCLQSNLFMQLLYT